MMTVYNPDSQTAAEAEHYRNVHRHRPLHDCHLSGVVSLVLTIKENRRIHPGGTALSEAHIQCKSIIAAAVSASLLYIRPFLYTQGVASAAIYHFNIVGCICLLGLFE